MARSKKPGDHMKPPAGKLGTAAFPFLRIAKSGLFRFIGGEVPREADPAFTQEYWDGQYHFPTNFLKLSESHQQAPC